VKPPFVDMLRPLSDEQKRENRKAVLRLTLRQLSPDERARVFHQMRHLDGFEEIYREIQGES